jgi:hypothetical protein
MGFWLVVVLLVGSALYVRARVFRSAGLRRSAPMRGEH